jgi:outer membrane protein
VRYKDTAIFTVATAVALLGYGGVRQAQQSSIKLGYINSAKILEQTPGAKEAQDTFEREMATWKSQAQALSDSLQQLVSEYEKQQVMLSPEKRQERQQQIQQMRQEYSERLQDLQTKAQQRQQELVQPVYDKISAVLANIRDEQGYTMIFDADAAGGSLVAADTTLNLTDQVITRLKAMRDTAGGAN